jgi:thioesterase domain-containing protein
MLHLQPRAAVPAAPPQPASCLRAQLERRALERGEAPALTVLAENGARLMQWSYADLDRRARAVAAALLEVARPGDRALLLLEPGVRSLEALLGCLYAGVIAVPLDPPDPFHPEPELPGLQAVWETVAPGVVLLSRPTTLVLPELLEHLPAMQRAPRLLVEAVGERAPLRLPALGPQLPAVIRCRGERQQILRHGELLDRTRGFVEVAGAWGAVVIDWGPTSHRAGLPGVTLGTWAAGGRCVRMASRGFAKDPARWLECASRFRATAAFAPPFALEKARQEVPEAWRQGLDLSSLGLIGVTEGPIRGGEVARFLEAYRPHGLRAAAWFGPSGARPDEAVGPDLLPAQPALEILSEPPDLPGLGTSGLVEARLHCLHPGVDRQREPLVLLHAAPYAPERFEALAGAFSDRPVYALPLPPTGSGPALAVPELASRCLTPLLSLGEISLCGWGAGGLVAWEVARLLAAGGAPPRRLALLDAPAPGAGGAMDPLAELAWFAASLSRGDAPLLSEAALRALPRREWLGALWEAALAAGALPAGTGPGALRAMLSLFRRDQQRLGALIERCPPRPYGGSARLLLAGDPVAADLHSRRTEGWAGLLAPEAAAEVPGDHFSMLAPPHLEALLGALRGYLDGG